MGGNSTQWVQEMSPAQGVCESIQGRCSAWGENQEQSRGSRELRQPREPGKSRGFSTVQRKTGLLGGNRRGRVFPGEVRFARCHEPEEEFPMSGAVG